MERAPEILAIGAGIHIPPNACRVLTNFGLLDKLKKAGGYEIEDFTLRRYEDGKVLVEKPLKGRMEKEYNAKWMYVYLVAAAEDRNDIPLTALNVAPFTEVTTRMHCWTMPLKPVPTS